MNPRTFILTDERVQESLVKVAKNLPLDGTIEVVIRLAQKKRSVAQNDLMWVRLTEISEQAWVSGLRYSPEVWHEHYKRQYLPEANDSELDRRVKKPEQYRKWTLTPAGDRVLIGSTTDLTKWGFADYLTQVEADGAGMGVQFSAHPSHGGAAR
jgi:hypothetical protein